jgi:hypothetical protein
MHGWTERLVAALGALSLLASAGAAAATPARGSGLPLVISPSDQVTVTRRDDGSWTVVDVRPTARTPETPAAPRGLPEEAMIAHDQPVHFGAPEGTVRFTLWATPQEGARLKLENNSGAAIIYSAEIVRRGQPRGDPTTICSVNNGTAAYEVWPDDIVAIRVTGFYPVAPGGRVCGYPERGDLSAPPPTIDAPEDDAPAGGSGGK